MVKRTNKSNRIQFRHDRQATVRKKHRFLNRRDLFQYKISPFFFPPPVVITYFPINKKLSSSKKKKGRDDGIKKNRLEKISDNLITKARTSFFFSFLFREKGKSSALKLKWKKGPLFFFSP